MTSFSAYLLSGVGANSTGTSIEVVGMKSFTAYFTSFNAGTGGLLNQLPTGRINFEARIDENSSFLPIYGVQFNGPVSGVFYQFNGPYEAIRGTSTLVQTGTFNLAVRYAQN